MIECLEILIQGRKETNKTQANIQPFCKFANIACAGQFTGSGVLPRCVKWKKSVSIFLIITFVFFFKSDVVGLKQAAEESKTILFNKIKL